MASILSEVEAPAIQEKEFAGPSNPMSQHAYEGFSKRQNRPASGLFLGAAAIAVVLVLASIFGLWLLRSVRRLNRQVAQLNHRTEQINRRLEDAEQQVKALDQKASQAAADAQTAALQSEQVRASQATSAGQRQSPLPTTAPTELGATRASTKAQDYRSQREKELQSLQQSLGQIAETHRTDLGLVMTLREKSIRFDSGKWEIAPPYRGILNRIAGVLKKLNGYSFYVYGYTDDNGTKDYNLTLSARRARAVRDALVKAGINPSVISTKGFGKSKPLIRSTTAKTRADNRRVEIGIVDSRKDSAEAANLSKAGTKR
jgi:outer membrane protein OmpA-like peptidoglycan-associated protein